MKRLHLSGKMTQFEVSEARLNGFIQAVKARVAIPEGYIKNIQFDPDHGKQIVAELMDLAEPPTALVIR